MRIQGFFCHFGEPTCLYDHPVVESVRLQIERGAFDYLLAAPICLRDIPLVIDHRKRAVVTRDVVVEGRPRGMRLTAYIPPRGHGADVRRWIRAGEIQGFSFGYDIYDLEWGKSQERWACGPDGILVQHILGIKKLHEITICHERPPGVARTKNFRILDDDLLDLQPARAGLAGRGQAVQRVTTSHAGAVTSPYLG